MLVMISVFVKEQRRYRFDELCQVFHQTQEEAIRLIHKLKAFGILKMVRPSNNQKDMSELLDDDCEIIDTENKRDCFYVFTFVGVAVIGECVLKCYPKYLSDNLQPHEALSQVLQVLSKYKSSKYQSLESSEESQHLNFLATMLFLLQDYYEYGLYSNTETIIENNGEGEIVWDKTVNETFPMLLNQRPYYMDLRTKRKRTNEEDFLRLLHSCVLTKISDKLQMLGLLSLFELTAVELTDIDLEDLGDTEYILHQIEKELQVQFNTRKQRLLKKLHLYLSHGSSTYGEDGFFVLGTNSFHMVWEHVCSQVMNNLLNSNVEDLTLPSPLQEDRYKGLTLKEVIEKPYWSATQKTATSALVPDLVTIKQNQFIIFDAKYYRPILELGEPPKGQPGIESITKQYWYQLAYQEFIKKHQFSDVKNCFLLPTDGDAIQDKGTVSLDMFQSLGLVDIQVRLLPAKMVYEYYLSDQKMDIDLLKL